MVRSGERIWPTTVGASTAPGIRQRGWSSISDWLLKMQEGEGCLVDGTGPL